MREEVIHCRKCGNVLGVLEGSFLCVRHRGRTVVIAMGRGSDVSIVCETCSFVTSLPLDLFT